MAETFRKTWENVMRRKFFRLGIPFVVFVAGGSFFLKQFASIRYEFRQGRNLSPEEAAKLGLKTVDVKSVEAEMLKEIQDKDFDQWENIRGPRPWEDSKTVQKELRENLDKTKAGDSR